VNEEYYKVLNAELGAEFDLFAVENPDWMANNVPNGAVVVMQTDDSAFSAWARSIAEQNRHLEDPPRPLVLVHIRELRPARSRIVRAEAELLAS
jgi:hypothetical protein